MRRPCEAPSSAGSEVEEETTLGRQKIISGHLKASFIRCGSPTTTTQVMTRKKRRGIIEKRRRDRINNSLSELRRLVPTALEKQGSAKLEKAEILQMTVDHLKRLQMTGGKGHLDTSILALDFLSLGFRECVTEVSHYLSAVEGLDSSDPLGSRLLSHLTSCTSQRDTAALTATSHQQPLHFPPLYPAHHWAALRPLQFGPSGLTVSPDSGGDAAPQRLVELLQHSVLPSSLLPLSASLPVTFHRGFPLLPSSSFTSSTSSPSITSSSSQPLPSSSKAYWPWGTEVGVF